MYENLPSTTLLIRILSGPLAEWLARWLTALRAPTVPGTYAQAMVASLLLRDFAEVPERFVDIPVTASVERLDDERRCIIHGPTWATITAISVETDAVDDLVAEVRSVVPTECQSLWHLGPSSRPRSLFEELERRGFARPAHRPSEVRALALTTEPEAHGDADVRLVETFEQFVAAREASWEAFGAPEERRMIERPLLRQGFDDMQRTGLPALFIANVDGRIAGSAVAVPSNRGVLLGGGSVATWARGQGLYRALVRTRWEYAAARQSRSSRARNWKRERILMVCSAFANKFPPVVAQRSDSNHIVLEPAQRARSMVGSECLP